MEEIVEVIIRICWILMILSLTVALVLNRKTIKKTEEIYQRVKRTLKNENILASAFYGPKKLIAEEDELCIKWSRNSLRAYEIATIAALAIFLISIFSAGQSITNIIQIIISGIFVILCETDTILAAKIYRMTKERISGLREVEKIDKKVADFYVEILGEALNRFLSRAGL